MLIFRRSTMDPGLTSFAVENRRDDDNWSFRDEQKRLGRLVTHPHTLA